MTIRCIEIDGKVIKFSRVKSVQDIGEKHVFDIEVEGVHNYFANGINVHNCQLHSLLGHYESKYPGEVFKSMDTFLHYKHRKLLLYPSGPNKRTLRGRTRFCLSGDTLINTNQGLLPLNDLGLIGHLTYRGKTTRTIIDHLTQGRKKTYTVTLENGVSFRATVDHGVRTVDENATLHWTEVDALVGKYAICQLGGEFSETLTFDYIDTQEHEVLPPYARALQLMLDRKTFTNPEIANIIWPDNERRTDLLSSILISPMRKAGIITTVARPQNLPWVYRIDTTKVVFDDWIASKGYINQQRRKVVLPKEMTPELATLIGYLIADGNIALIGEEITFTTSNPKKHKHFKTCVYAVFGYTCRETIWYKKEDNSKYYVARIAYKRIKNFLLYLGIGDQWSYTKVIPWSILQAPRKCATACLSAMISCDGSISKTSIYYYSVSKDLVQTTQQLLLKLGYAARVQKLSDGGYQVILGHYDASRFLKSEYTGLSKRHYRKDDLNKVIGKGTAHSIYRIPFTSSMNTYNTWYLHTVSKINTDLNESIKEYGYTGAYDHHLSLHRKWSKFIDSNVIFSKVLSVEYYGIEETYDIEVDALDHTFPANSVLVHNCSAIDELGWFAAGDAAEGKVLISGDEIYTALDRSLLTVRAAALNLWKQGYVHIPTAYAFNISSPSSIRDNIMVLVKNNLTSRSILTSQLATWELNPNIRRSDLNNEFKNDPVKAERDYGANPPLGDSLYIEDVEGIAACFTGRKNAIEYKYIQKVTERRVLRAAKITKTHQPSLIPPSVLSLDAGVTNNSFSMTLLHRNPNEKGPKVVVPLMVEVIPEKGTMHLNFARIVSELIHPIIDQFNVQGVVADRWQSILLLHQLAEDFGIYTEQYSVRREDFDLVKSYLLGGEFEMPKLSQKPDSILTPELTNYPNCFDFKPVDHLFLQILTVKDAGRTITKGTGLTDDLFRALVLGSAYVLDDDWADQYLRVASQKSDMGIGAIGSIGGSNSTLSTTKIGSVGGMGGSSGGGGASVFARIR